MLILRIAFLILVFLLLTPSFAVAQPNVCGFYGTVYWDDKPVADGTTITALVDNEEVASATTEDSQYSMKVACGDCSGKTVLFSIPFEDRTVVVADGDWMAGDNIRLDIEGAQMCGSHLPAYIEIEHEVRLLSNVSGNDFFTHRPIEVRWDDDIIATAFTDIHDMSPCPKGHFYSLLIPPTNMPGTYTVTASDDLGRSDSAILYYTSNQGPMGEQGPEGQPGEQGPMGRQGLNGESSSTTLSIVGLIASIAALVTVLVLGFRRSIPGRKSASIVQTEEEGDLND